ncbi:MAG: ATP-binding cassette domain-containing protein [Chthoniobacterales bacterium]|nr:ATP-binding cassette domain-containing protein [Chthoniobacterales bacterium]
MVTTPPIIEVRDLTAAYGDFVLLEKISFDIRRGEIFVIIGGSGCGKSTLMKHLIGLIAPAGGEILLDGLNISTAAGTKKAELLKSFGVMYQSGALFGSMTLEENVMLALEEFTDLPVEARQLVARMKLALVGLERFAAHFPSEVSGGMQKRAAIARAMALDPAVLFLDEPSAGLDPVTSAGLDELILNLNHNLGVTFVIVSHELASIYAVADRVIMLDSTKKGILAEGPPADLRDHDNNPGVRAFFHRMPRESIP